MAKISVIIPVYNAASTIKKCIRSVLNQSEHDLEVIVIDDASNDLSENIVHQIALVDCRVKYIRQDKNRGPAAARNKGIDYATGEYVTFVDADDELLPEMEKMLVSNMKVYHADMSACGYYLVSQQSVINGTEHDGDTPFSMSALDASKAIAMKNGCCMKGYVWCKLFKKRIIDENNIRFNESLYMCEDELFCHEYLLHCKKHIVYDPRPYYCYFYSPEGLTNAKLNQNKMTVFDAYDNIINMCSNFHDYELTELLEANKLCWITEVIKIAVKYMDESQFVFSDIAFNMMSIYMKKYFINAFIKKKTKIRVIQLKIMYPIYMKYRCFRAVIRRLV